VVDQPNLHFKTLYFLYLFICLDDNEIGEHLLRPRSANPQLIPFKALTKQELSQISKYFEKKTVPAETTLFSYGQERSYFYIIEKGTKYKFI
jgi:hypothetical protein